MSPHPPAGRTPGVAPLVLTASALENPSIDVVVAAALEAGFDGLSLWPGAGYGLDAAHRRAIDAAGLFVWDVDAVVAWVGADDPGGPYFEEAPADAVLDAAAALGARAVNVLLIGPRGTDARTAPDRCAETFARVAARVAGLGMRCTLEFAKSTAVADLHQANAVVRASGADNAGVLVDTWHHHWSGVRDAPFDLVRAIQLSDAPAERPVDFPQATRHRREVPGTGAVDFAPLLRGAPAATPLVVEVFNGALLARHGTFGFARLLGDAARTVRSAAAADADADAPADADADAPAASEPPRDAG
jgi:sugar phosphate isomerase/epimerase